LPCDGADFHADFPHHPDRWPKSDERPRELMPFIPDRRPIDKVPDDVIVIFCFSVFLSVQKVHVQSTIRLLNAPQTFAAVSVAPVYENNPWRSNNV